MPRGRKPKADLTKELLKIQKAYGSLSAGLVLKEAKKKRHPLHTYFNWDDSDAAKKWRLHQANMLITRAQITITDHEERTISAFISVNKEEGREFVHTAEAINDDQIALQIFSQLEARIATLQDHLQSLDLLQGISKTALTSAKTPITKRRIQLEKKVARAVKKKKSKKAA